MNIRMGSQVFLDVTIPLLWGTRAVLQDDEGSVSVIDLSGPRARLEVLSDRPAPGIEYVPDVDGFRVRHSGEDLYRYNPRTKTLAALGWRLPEVEISAAGTRVGTNFIGGGSLVGLGVGISVQEDSLAIGAPLPQGLAELVI